MWFGKSIKYGMELEMNTINLHLQKIKNTIKNIRINNKRIV